MWNIDHAKPVQYVRQLHSISSGHHRRHPKASHHIVVQRMQPIPATTQKLDQGRARVKRATHVLCEANERASKG